MNAPRLGFLVAVGRFPIVDIILVVIALFVTILYRHGVFGQTLMAIGGDEVAVSRFGVPVDRYKILVFGLSGTMVGLASVISLAQYGAAGPLTGLGKELEAISAVVLGGTPLTGGSGSAMKTLIGALALVLLADGLTMVGVPPSWTDIVRGCLLIVAIAIALDRSKIGVVK